MKKALYGLRTSPKQWQEHVSTILKEMGFNRLKSDACIFGNVKTNVYLMAYVDDLLVVGNPLTVKPFLEQFKVKLKLKHISQSTIDAPLEFLGKSIELQQDGTIHLSFSAQYYGKILKPHNME
eukprot:4076051-Amphidinium_carterae.1